MIEGYGRVTQALLGTLLTWGLTAAGACCVLFLRGTQRKSLDAALGFAAGIMVAASFWSLLNPAIEMAEDSQLYGAYAFLPVTIGFLIGAVFVFGCDLLITKFSLDTFNIILQMSDKESVKAGTENVSVHYQANNEGNNGDNDHNQHVRLEMPPDSVSIHGENNPSSAAEQWKRIILLVVAITVHNIPEGLAVGVSFGAIGSTNSSTFESARNLAIGIGIQNFPEGLAVSLPLRAAGFGMGRAIWYGQLSGMVEPIFGVLGAFAVTMVSLVLPYALAFAAGAMIYIVVDDILPEANSGGHGLLATWSAMIGFMLMMILDVALG